MYVRLNVQTEGLLSEELEEAELNMLSVALPSRSPSSMPGASRSQSPGRSRSVSPIQASSMESRENFDTIVNNLLDQQFAAQEQYSTRGKYDGQILNALFGLYNHDTRRVKTKREDSLQELLTAYKD